MRSSTLFMVSVVGLAACLDLAALQSGEQDMAMPQSDLLTGGDMPTQGDMAPADLSPLPPSWTVVHTVTGTRLNAISGSIRGSESITAVGDAQTVVRGSGSAFQTATIAGAASDLQALWVNGGMEVWTVGTDGQVWRTTNGGAAWTDMMSGTSEGLRGIFARNGSSTDIVVAGDDTDRIRHWDGTAWADGDHGRGDVMHGVWASSQRFWVVGDSGDSATDTDPRSMWTNISDISGGPRMNAIAGLDDNNVWAVTEGGGLYKYDAARTEWDSVSSTTGALRAMWIASATEIWVAGVNGPNGIVLRCNPVARSCTNLSTAMLGQHTITGIWGNGSGGIWLTANSGSNGVIFKN